MTTRPLCLLIVLVVIAAPGFAQLEWDKPKNNQPLPNPSPVNASRDEVILIVKDILARNQLTIQSEQAGEGRSAHVIITEPTVFTRGTVAKTQMSHFAETDALRSRYITRARVSLRIELSPTTPTSTLVGIFATFQGLSQGAQQEWITSPSRGLLEDSFLKRVVVHSLGISEEDLEKEQNLLEVNDTSSLRAPIHPRHARLSR